jgi:hypothetical protein
MAISQVYTWAIAAGSAWVFPLDGYSLDFVDLFEPK